MASSKARSKKRPASSQGGRSAARDNQRSSRTILAVAATPTAPAGPAKRLAPTRAVREEPAPEALAEDVAAPGTSAGPPLWLQIITFVLAILGLAISAYETYAHYSGTNLAGCSVKAGGTFDCAAVINSPQSMVFNVFPVAVLGLAFYLFAAVPLFSPWGWRMPWREVHIARLASMIVGMGFVMYLIYAEVSQIQEVCEYCTGVHIVTFLLFCVTVFSTAIWGLGSRRLLGGSRS